MAVVQGKYPDYSKHNNEAYFRLASDQAMNPYTWKPPINWEGKVNGKHVSFTQISASGHSKDDYDFSNFPKDVEDAISNIIIAIDEKMKVMD